MIEELLSGKQALVTGASGGLGRAISYIFGESGISTFLTGRSEEKLSVSCREFEKNKWPLLGSMACDVATDIDWLIREVHRRNLNIDILINCAGVFFNKSLEDTTVEEFDLLHSVNLRAAYILTKEFGPKMAENGWGRIVNVGSTSSVNGFANSAAYCASKHGLLGLNRATNAEFKDRGVQAMCVCPGTIDTDMGSKVVGVDSSAMIDSKGLSDFILRLLEVEGGFAIPEVIVPRSNLR